MVCILITGKSGSGKTTSSNYLLTQLNKKQTNSCISIALAYKLKVICHSIINHIFDISISINDDIKDIIHPKIDITLREIYQFVGEYLKTIYDNYIWCNYINKQINNIDKINFKPQKYDGIMKFFNYYNTDLNQYIDQLLINQYKYENLYHKYIIINDCRFNYEINYFKSKNHCILCKLIGRENKYINKSHISEQFKDIDNYDMIIKNKYNIKILYKNLDNFLKLIII